MSIIDQGFDQVALINALGGSVKQVGGSNNGGVLLDASDFGGAPSATTGVDVTLPGYQYAFDATVMDGGSSEPGNLSSILLGSPTDLTFTLPGAGGPDGTLGDGSLQLLAGGMLTLSLGASVFAPVGETADIFLFTDTAGGGSIDIELLLGSTVVDSITVNLPGAIAGSGQGGVLLDVLDGLEYEAIRLVASQTSTSVEIDAVAVAGATVPEPAAFALVALGLLALLALRTGASDGARASPGTPVRPLRT